MCTSNQQTQILTDSQDGRRLQQVADMIINPNLPLQDLETICDSMNTKAIYNLHSYLQQTVDNNTTVHVVTLRNDIKQALNHKLAEYHAAASNQQLITWSSTHTIISMQPPTTATQVAHDLAATIFVKKQKHVIS